jgi:hypothetical protein
MAKDAPEGRGDSSAEKQQPRSEREEEIRKHNERRLATMSQKPGEAKEKPSS